MKILGISASPRKEESESLSLLKEALSSIEKSGVRTGLVQLPDLKIEFCLACDHCHKKTGCIIDDDVFGLLDKILESDGLIFATPVYIRSVTASLKAVMDRSSHFIHCQRLLGKYACAIVTSGGGRGEEVLDFIQDYFLITGSQYVGGVSAKAPVNKRCKKEARKLGIDVVTAIKEKREYPEQIGRIKGFRDFFKGVMESQKNEWLEEYKYWQKKGWL